MNPTAPAPTSGLTPPTSLVTSQTNSFQTFDEYSQFLRESVADEESLQVGESLQALATQIEAVTDLWRGAEPQPEWLGPELERVLHGVQAHHTLVSELGQDWHRYFELGAHLAAVKQFQAQLAHWVQLNAWASATPPNAADFDLSAWRVLGAGALLLDVYEQSSRRHKSRKRRAVKGWSAWWARCAGWLLAKLGRKDRGHPPGRKT
jgi:hypothetical protein